MSLISTCYSCRWCGKIAGDEASHWSLRPPRTHCPHCGCPIQRPLNYEPKVKQLYSVEGVCLMPDGRAKGCTTTVKPDGDLG